MALTPDEMDLLDQAFDKGAMGNLVQLPNGQMQVDGSSAVRKVVRGLSDEQVRVKLRAFQAQELSAYDNKILAAQAAITDNQTKRATLNAKVITEPTSTTSAS